MTEEELQELKRGDEIDISIRVKYVGFTKNHIICDIGQFNPLFYVAYEKIKSINKTNAKKDNE